MRVLIISPHFPPTNAADMQRVRLITPYLKENGIEAEILAVEPGQVTQPQDPWLEEGLPAEVPIHRVKALSPKWGCIPGFGSLSWRAYHALRRKGSQLLRNSNFDLVYFSNTQASIHKLGPEWNSRYGVPFILDYQDPWVNDYYKEHPELSPPGGRLKYAVADRINRFLEPRVLRQCSGITSVSTAYPEQLDKRYPWLDVIQEHPHSVTEGCKALHQFPSIVLPFPGDSIDLERTKAEKVRQHCFDPNGGETNWVYVGVCPPQMHPALKGLFSALELAGSRYPDQLRKLRLHFIGTSYAAPGMGQSSIPALAKEFGLAENVIESPDRIPYSASLRCLLDADALIVLGSDDPGYTASKIYPYLLAGKPLVTIFHEQSSINTLIQNVGGANAFSFTSDTPTSTIAKTIADNLFSDSLSIAKVPLDLEAFIPHTARNQANKLAHFFRIVLH